MIATSLTVGKATHIGQVRARNEDAYDLRQSDGDARGSLFLVADGMGGHSAGNVASHMAVEQVMAHYYGFPEENPSERLRQSVEEANRRIYDAAQSNMEYFRMGTTIVGAAILANRAHVANVGDSRLYLVRNGEIQQITRDHSWVALQVEMGELTPEEALVSQNRSVLLRCLGEKSDVLVDVVQLVLFPGDVLILCTDGLHGLVSADEIRDKVLAEQPQAACDQLVATANARGGHDNITVEIVRVDNCPPPAPGDEGGLAEGAAGGSESAEAAGDGAQSETMVASATAVGAMPARIIQVPPPATPPPVYVAPPAASAPAPAPSAPPPVPVARAQAAG
ncbi:MAG: Stp1/IreP family PP2C-type Ser/Thr phosphatase, partial [Armatimonadetes bacterium]|nr:Stp1/IreP family PP2C-type Ser/Thr phosphatase [Armatimonadota bacterium]